MIAIAGGTTIKRIKNAMRDSPDRMVDREYARKAPII
jgi:hypothetical protein